MPIRVLAVGKKHEAWVNDGIERYQKRLVAPWQIEWVLIPHSALNGASARQEESRRLLTKLSPHDFVVLLDEQGQTLDSPALSRKLMLALDSSKRVVLVIGGAYGVDQTALERADLVWSLSKLVFPHQLVRLLVVEQLYRSQEIALEHPYHHS